MATAPEVAVTPDRSNQLPDSIGNLARLAVMPVEVEIKEGSVETARDIAKFLETEVVEQLGKAKGYEIVQVADEEGQWRKDLVTSPATESAITLELLWKRYGRRRSVSESANRNNAER